MIQSESEWIDYWRKHIRGNKVIAFPRDFNLNRATVATESHYLTLCKLARRNRLPAYSAVYSRFEVENQLATTIFYDLDILHYHKVDHYHNDNHQDIVKNQLAGRVRVIFSGCKGFHIYVDLDPVKIADLKAAAEMVAELIGVADSVDRRVLGDWRRMSRIPGTFHQVSGREVQVISPSTDPQISAELSRIIARKFGSRSSYLKVQLPAEVGETRVMELGEPPLCIQHLIVKALSGQALSHVERLHLGVFLVNAVGLSPDEAAIIFSRQPDFSFTITHYQLNWLRDHRYRMFKCHTAAQLGICPIPHQPYLCKHYPTPNRWL